MSVAETNLENIIVDKKDGIAYITMNRPKVLNALNAATVAELTGAFEDVQSDDSIKGAIITGGADKAFIAGADISEIASVTPTKAVQMTRNGQALMSLIEGLGKPVIAAVNGLALGGGCETAMACSSSFPAP